MDKIVEDILSQINAPIKAHERGIVVWATPNTFTSLINDEHRFQVEVGILSPTQRIVVAKLDVQKQTQPDTVTPTGFMPHSGDEANVNIADVVRYLINHISTLGQPTTVECSL